MPPERVQEMTLPGEPAWHRASPADAASPANEERPIADPLVLPVLEESLLVRKREVATGGYRLTKIVESERHTVDEPLERSTVTIERVAVDRLLAKGEVPSVRQEGDVTIFPVLREAIVTEKRLVLVEEVRVTRVSSTFRQPQTVTLRQEEILVERMPDGSDDPSGK